MDIKDIAATLAILGSGALLAGCGKSPASEVPGGAEAAPPPDESHASCATGHTEEGHCAGREGGQGIDGGEGSCVG